MQPIGVWHAAALTWQPGSLEPALTILPCLDLL